MMQWCQYCGTLRNAICQCGRGYQRHTYHACLVSYCRKNSYPVNMFRYAVTFSQQGMVISWHTEEQLKALDIRPSASKLMNWVTLSQDDITEYIEWNFAKITNMRFYNKNSFCLFDSVENGRNTCFMLISCQLYSSTYKIYLTFQFGFISTRALYLY